MVAARVEVRVDPGAHGRVVATTPPATTTLTWPGEAPSEVTFRPLGGPSL